MAPDRADLMVLQYAATISAVLCRSKFASRSSEQMGWVLALIVGGVFVLIVVVVAFWLSR
jgi:hypothetical protein